MQDEREPLGGSQRFQDDEQGDTERVAQQRSRFRVDLQQLLDGGAQEQRSVRDVGGGKLIATCRTPTATSSD